MARARAALRAGIAATIPTLRKAKIPMAAGAIDACEVSSVRSAKSQNPYASSMRSTFFFDL